MSLYSPNSNNRPLDTPITAIVLHATASKTWKPAYDWMMDSKAKVSSHYLIGTDGIVAQLVLEDRRAWHAGDSKWRSKTGLNDFSIGIEIVNPNDGVTPYTTEQYKAVAELCADICLRHPIQAADIVAHADVSPGRKTDPLGWDWQRFYGHFHAFVRELIELRESGGTPAQI